MHKKGCTTFLGAIAVSNLSACGSIHKDRVWARISIQEVRNCISAHFCTLTLAQMNIFLFGLVML